MSGSRHQQMNAIRIRKENQVYSAEDKRALAMFNYNEKAKQEHKVMADLQRLVQRHIGQDVGPTHDPFAAKASDVADLPGGICIWRRVFQLLLELRRPLEPGLGKSYIRHASHTRSKQDKRGLGFV